MYLSPQGYIRQSINRETRLLGGTVYENTELPLGDYTVEHDLHIIPGAKLELAPGATLRFEDSIGMLVEGELSRTRFHGDTRYVTFTKKVSFIFEYQRRLRALLQSFRVPTNNNIRLVDANGVEGVLEGRLEVRTSPQTEVIHNFCNYTRICRARHLSFPTLQVRLSHNSDWGTICNRSWNVHLAAKACHQLGLTIDPEYNEYWLTYVLPGFQPIVMDNIRCEEDGETFL